MNPKHVIVHLERMRDAALIHQENPEQLSAERLAEIVEKSSKSLLMQMFNK